MAKEGKDNKFITVFVVVLLAVVLLGALANMFVAPTTLSTATNEAFLLNATGVGCYADGQVNTSNSACNLTVAHVPVDVGGTGISSVVVTNNSGTALTADTDYTVSAHTGKINLLNTTSTDSTFTSNYVKVSYQYPGTGYLDVDWGRSVLVVTLGLFALGILIVVIYFAMERFQGSD